MLLLLLNCKIPARLLLNRKIPARLLLNRKIPRATWLLLNRSIQTLLKADSGRRKSTTLRNVLLHLLLVQLLAVAAAAPGVYVVEVLEL
jgi:hypothetical protein